MEWAIGWNLWIRENLIKNEVAGFVLGGEWVGVDIPVTFHPNENYVIDMRLGGFFTVRILHAAFISQTANWIKVEWTAKH